MRGTGMTRAVQKFQPRIIPVLTPSHLRKKYFGLDDQPEHRTIITREGEEGIRPV